MIKEDKIKILDVIAKFDGHKNGYRDLGLISPPDYFNLDEIYKLEGKLYCSDFENYIFNLGKILYPKGNRNDWRFIDFVQLSAENRLKGLYQTILDKENKEKTKT